ncbi:type IV toxin-antitoxin system AbiEi family antitoxin domain-containing protein [Nonomuraea sp. NPDC046802]|uniref:type IV toxin-antitoxin system AbiEi family antitoxin domain-containing protein n=1 Tax=Nonomuraea sp. NPDC046802 TaxID=3154919 RepID=UPI00340F8B51
MSPQGTSRLASRLAGLPPTFTTAQARLASLSSRDLADLIADGKILELSRGVHRQASAPETAYLDLLTVCIRAPHAVVCDESALALHELIDDIPTAVHIAVPRGQHRPSYSYPPVVVAQYSPDTFNLGIEDFPVSPEESVPVYSAARSVVDAMRHRGRIGETLALSALGRYLRRSDQRKLNELQRIAHQLHALSLIRPAIEAVLA